MKRERARREAGEGGKKQKLYAVYDAKTDELLAFGTASECRDQMDMKNTYTFYETCSRVARGINKKYVVLVLDDIEDEESAISV